MPHHFFVHGHTGKNINGKRQRCSREYGVWQQMLNRCRRTNDPGYKNYGGRGIAVCERWKSFVNFLADMGPCPEGMSIDRIDNDGHYEPGNCRWATSRQQCNNTRWNRRITHNGVTRTIAEWSREVGLGYATFKTRLEDGWSVAEALSEPTRQRTALTYNGQTKTVAEWCRVLGVKRCQVEGRLKRGWPVELALTAPKNMKRHRAA